MLQQLPFGHPMRVHIAIALMVPERGALSRTCSGCGVPASGEVAGTGEIGCTPSWWCSCVGGGEASVTFGGAVAGILWGAGARGVAGAAW